MTTTLVKKESTKSLSAVPPKVVNIHSAKYKALLEATGAVIGTAAKKIQNSRPCYSTGCIGLDLAIGRVDPDGYIGIPERSIVELFGPNGVLKSGTLQQLIVSVQQRGLLAVVLYTEEPDFDRMEREGVNLEQLVVLDAYDPRKRKSSELLAERKLAELIEWSKSEDVGLIAIDSIKSLVSAKHIYEKGDSRKQKDRGFAESDVAIRAQLLEKFFDRVKPRNKRAILVLVNQKNEGIGPTYEIGAEARPKSSGGRRAYSGENGPRIRTKWPGGYDRI